MIEMRNAEWSRLPRRPMNLLICASDYKPNHGGRAEFAYSLAKCLAEAGITIHVAAPIQDGALVFDRHCATFPTHRMRPSPRLAAFSLRRMAGNLPKVVRCLLELRRQAAELEKIVVDHKIGAIICFQWDPYGVLAWLIHARTRIPYYIVAHGAELHDRRRSFLWALREGCQWSMQSVAFSRAAGVFANSDYTKNVVIRNVQSGKQCVVTYCGVDTNRFRPRPKRRDLIETLKLADKRILLTVSRLVPRKGIDKTIAALHSLYEKYPSCNVQYLIAGCGPDEPRLRALAVELNLGEKVQFIGSVDEHEKVDYYNLADAFIMASRAQSNSDVEGFGIVYAEAGSCGKPVIAGDSGGVRSVVRDGYNGILVDPLDVHSIRNGIERILCNADFAHRLGMNGRKLVESEFQWDRVAARFAETILKPREGCGGTDQEASEASVPGARRKSG
jgi:phosphatidylinositol alpha-1,6-mannosyltransferase